MRTHERPSVVVVSFERRMRRFYSCVCRQTFTCLSKVLDPDATTAVQCWDLVAIVRLRGVRMCGTENERVMIPHKKEERTASKEAVRSRPATISRNINFV